jgi:hypothetical protein
LLIIWLLRVVAVVVLLAAAAVLVAIERPQGHLVALREQQKPH